MQATQQTADEDQYMDLEDELAQALAESQAENESIPIDVDGAANDKHKEAARIILGTLAKGKKGGVFKRLKPAPTWGAAPGGNGAASNGGAVGAGGARGSG